MRFLEANGRLGSGTPEHTAAVPEETTAPLPLEELIQDWIGCRASAEVLDAFAGQEARDSANFPDIGYLQRSPV